jgi:hypothetical protein
MGYLSGTPVEKIARGCVVHRDVFGRAWRCIRTIGAETASKLAG